MSDQQSAPACNLCAAALPATSVRWVKDGYEIASCPSCELVQRRHLPTEEELAAIYADEYFKRADDDDSGQGYLDYLADAVEHRLNANKRLDRLQEHAVAPGALLDVGGAAGFFAAEARTRGWTVGGMDASPTMAAYARDTLGLDAFQSVGFDGFVPDREYDVVTMWDYIEHSCDPQGDLRRAASVIRPGGILALSTGDIETPVARLSGRRWHLLTPRHHNFYFSRRTLTRALEAAGFEVLEAEHRAAYFSVGYLVHKLRTLMPETRALNRLFATVSRRSRSRSIVGVNLGDIVTITARRVTES